MITEVLIGGEAACPPCGHDPYARNAVAGYPLCGGETPATPPICGGFTPAPPPGAGGPQTPGKVIRPGRDLGAALLDVEKPARYTGGEYGRLARIDAGFQALIAFPDCYEIGMCNQALRIIYRGLNRLDGISCDRAFAPAPDFEALLRQRGLPLYGLDTGIPLADADLLCFTLGYELGITGILTMLDVSGIPLRRSPGYSGPLVILGGPCASNPRPYAAFIDAFWIGEAEAGFFDLAQDMAALKREWRRKGEGRGGLRDALFDLAASHPAVWVPGKARTRRAIDTAFASRSPDAAVFPVPSMKTAQHHGAVEIMRGCPNGCRFCHAGVWYRPMRQKSAATVRAEAAAFIKQGGYREISLSSLSTGDYRHIGGLVEALNRDYAPFRVSFQLPSLRVSTFSLSLLEKVSLVRKSGLTFAVETPLDIQQMALNKEVGRDAVTAILKAARKNGWRSAKFYFMIGLPPAGTAQPAGPAPDEAPAAIGSPGSEEEEIVSFVLDVSRRTGMRFHVNAGTFIPKPHTPYQWSPQLDEGRAGEKLAYIKRRLAPAGHKVGLHDPFVSLIEGLFSRGDGRVGDLAEEAFRRGCRLDAWDEFLRKDLWRSVLEPQGALIREVLGARDPERALPWDPIDSGMSRAFLLGEMAKSNAAQMTGPCAESCGHPCGICPGRGRVAANGDADQCADPPAPSEEPAAGGGDAAGAAYTGPRPAPSAQPAAGDTFRILFSFTKTGSAVWLSHLSLIELFSMAMFRAEIPARFSQGFNPLPRLDFAAPLAVGVSAAGEIAILDTEGFLDAAVFQERLNLQLPEGFQVTRAANFRIPAGVKKHSPAALLWGFAYAAAGPAPDYVQATDEKAYRQARTASGASLYDLERQQVLAQRPGSPDQGASYFSVYEALYP